MHTTAEPNQTSGKRCLTDAELAEVSGGQGNLANGCIRAVTQWFLDNTYRNDQYNYDCPPGLMR
jgi:hypothetical protein